MTFDIPDIEKRHFMKHGRRGIGRRRIPGWMKTELERKKKAKKKKKKNAPSTVSAASLARGIRAKFVKIRRVKNGIRVTIKK